MCGLVFFFSHIFTNAIVTRQEQSRDDKKKKKNKKKHTTKLSCEDLGKKFVNAPPPPPPPDVPYAPADQRSCLFIFDNIFGLGLVWWGGLLLDVRDRGIQGACCAKWASDTWRWRCARAEPEVQEKILKEHVQAARPEILNDYMEARCPVKSHRCRAGRRNPWSLRSALAAECTTKSIGGKASRVLS